MTYVPNKDAKGIRRYGAWAGNPHGVREDETRCIAQVPQPPSWTEAQCSRKRGHGPEGAYCKQHARKFAVT